MYVNLTLEAVPGKTLASSRFCDLKCIMGSCGSITCALSLPSPFSDTTWRRHFVSEFDATLTAILLGEFRIYSDHSTDGDCGSSGKTSQDIFGEFSFVFLSSLNVLYDGVLGPH